MSSSCELETLVEITEILNGPLPILGKCESVLAVLAGFTSSELVTLRELEPETSTLRLIASYNVMTPDADLRLRIPADAYLSAKSLVIKSPVAVNDYSASETRPRGYVAGVNSALSVPIQIEGKIFGTLGFGSRSTGNYPEDIARVLLTVGIIVGMMIGKAKVQESSDRSNALLEEAPLGIIVAGDDGVMIQTNRHLETLFGYNRGELVGNRVEILVPESFRGAHTAHRAGYLRNPTSRPMGEGLRLIGRRKDGSEFPVAIGLSTIDILGGRLTLAHVADDTLRNEQEEFLKTIGVQLGDRLEAREAEMAVVDQISKIITSTLDIDQEYGRFALEVKKLIPFDRATLVDVDRQANSYTIRNTWGLEIPSVQPGDSFSLDGWTIEGSAPTLKGIFLPELNPKADSRALKPLKEAGLHSHVMAPLVSNNQVIGAISLMSRESNVFGLREQAILERLASQIAPAIENARLYQEAQERAHEIQRLNEFTNRILDSNPSALVVLKRSEREIVTVNSSFCAAFTLDKNQIVGQPLFQALEWDGLEACVDESLSTPSGEGRKEIKYTGHDGRERWFLIFAVPLLLDDDTDSEDETLLVLSDITEQRQQQLRLQNHSRLASVGELASGVAHEINNPLAAIYGLSELLQMEDLPFQVSEDVRKIQEAALRAAKVVQNLLSFARTHEPEKRYLDVASIVDQALELKAHDFNFENIRVSTNHSGRVPPTMVDEHQFIQVMLNILTNAEQSIKASQGPGEIKIATQLFKNMIRISISDDGLGIPASNLHSIFDPFFSTKEVGEGTGLGLSICYGIVREHGGELWVESTPGNGATFHIELPVLPDATLVQTRSTDTACGPVASRRILVVDDEPVVRNFLSRALSADGHDVEFASDGEAAWKLIQGSRFDVILLDLRMPGVDGQELYKLITDLSPEMSKRVVFITGDTASADTRTFLDSTANPVLSKPFTLEAVRQLL